MKRNNIVLITIAIITLLALVTFAAYAYFANNATITNVTNLNVVSERNNMVFDTIGGGMILNVTASNMMQSVAENIAAENNTTLTVNFQANTSYSMVCTYDIVYEWTSSDKYQSHTQGVTDDEFTIQANLASNAHVYRGSNSIVSETDLSTAVGNQNSAIVVTGAQIDSTGTSTSTATWTITGKFYNVDANQNTLADKTYEGRFKVANVSCIQGEVAIPGPTSYWYPTTLATLNSNTNQYEPTYTFPATGGTVQSSGTATGHNVYIGQDSSKYYACLNVTASYLNSENITYTFQGMSTEVCLSQPYTQYGLSGHTLNTNFTSAQQTSATQAIYQEFIDAGISIDIENNCGFYGHSGTCCSVGDLICGVSYDGRVSCEEFSDDTYCDVDSDGRALCL